LRLLLPCLKANWLPWNYLKTLKGNVMEKELLRYWLALLRLPGYGPIKTGQLLKDNPNIVALFNNPPSHLTDKARAYLKDPAWDLVENDLAWLAQDDCDFIPIVSEEYPALLREIADPPIGLFVQGDKDLLSVPQIAMVGSRNPSSSGQETAHSFAHHFAQAGFCITSGLAMGIDGSSHKGALKADGMTIAVTGTGLDRVYPASHKDLAHQIVQNGCMVSEYPPGTAAKPANFPKRNRIISGLSIGTLVVEAALRSGSLITAKQATEQGREVFAIPGSIHNPLARGCHSLIKQGVKLVETAQDVIEELGAYLSENENKTNADTRPYKTETKLQSAQLDDDYIQLLKHIDHDPVSTDQLIERSGFSAEMLSSMLLRLELEEVISPNPGGYFTLTTNID